MKYWFSILLCVKFMLLLSQNGQGYYHDYNNSFYVFDKGIERQAEVNRVTDIYSGNDYVAYTDSKLSFVYYYNGYQKVLEENFPNKVVATAPALIYKMQERLMICEKGETKQLARRADVFFASDSIVIWQALPSLDYMAYVNGETKIIIKSTNSSVINDYKINNNIMAFNDLKNQTQSQWGSKYEYLKKLGDSNFIEKMKKDYGNTLEITYEGGGDSGQINDYGDSETSSVRLNEDIEYTGYEIIDLYHSGWENNEGGDGRIKFNFDEGTVMLSHNMNYEDEFVQDIGEFKLV